MAYGKGVPIGDSTMVMSELRQRRRNNTSSAVAAVELNAPDTRKKHIITSSPTKKLISILLFLCYIPILIIINPITVPTIYYKIFPTVCQGICSLESLDVDNKLCSPADPTRVIFLRIPKTGSSTVTSLFKSQSNIKSTLSVDLGEIENLVPSLPISNNHNGNIPQGYYDPSIQAIQSHLVQFYKQSSLKVLASLNGRDRSVFDGHFRYYNFLERGYKYVSPIAEWRLKLPQFIQELYNHLPTNEELAAQNSKYGIPTISFVRQPFERLSSMYYFDRSQARNMYWRKDFIQQRGNATLDECLTNSTCLEVNELQRWCNIQTAMLCGVEEKECMGTPLSKKALQIAKRNIKDELLFVGVTERMGESVSILEKILPTYLEGVSDVEIVHKNVGEARRIVRQKGKDKEIFSKEAKRVLKDICSLDLELYEYVNKMLTQRVKECI